MEWKDLDEGIFLVNVLGIVYDSKTKKILIGRVENDPYVKELTWCFPGGRPSYEHDLEFSLKQQIKIKTNLEVDVKKIIFTRIYQEKKEFLLIYYYCEVISEEEKPGEKFKELKWVKPTEVKNYFTTSLHPKVFEFLKSLEEGES